MSRESYDALEKRIKELEEEVKKMKEPIESTLMDIRQLISELENPFNYIAKLIDLDKIPAEKIAVNKEQTGNILQRDHEWKSRDNEYREVMVREPRESYKEIKKTGQGYLVEPHLLNYLSCACILVKLLGHEYTVRFLATMIAVSALITVLAKIMYGFTILIREWFPIFSILPPTQFQTYSYILILIVALLSSAAIYFVEGDSAFTYTYFLGLLLSMSGLIYMAVSMASDTLFQMFLKFEEGMEDIVGGIR
ncbi:MAG: hypothetical protein QXP74_03980 [Nitrososphaerota archaeon]